MSVFQALEIIKKYYESNAFSVDETEAFLVLFDREEKPKRMSTTFYCNDSCEYFPCHKDIDEENFSCMFCYCPLYALKNKCGGDFSYTASGIKDCSNCSFPHKKENYDLMVERTMQLVELARKQVYI